jgi:serine/threonine-protein kinase
MDVPKPTIDQVCAAVSEYSAPVEIGCGGFKTVFRAYHNGNPEVLKFIGLPTGSDLSPDAKAFRDECLGRAKREIKLLGQCKSSTIVKLGTLEPQLISIGEVDYVVYSEESLEGNDLGKLIKTNVEKPSATECIELLKSLISAIVELWSLGIIHRDIKPQNVIKLNDQKRPFVVLDLGIAFSVIDTALTFNAMNRLPPATFRYIAPEMANPGFRSTLDYRSDLYSAALTVFEYASHVHPIAKDGDDSLKTIARAITDAPKSLFQLRNDLPVAFCQLIDQLLKKKPALRPSNPQLLLTRLDQLI